MCRGIIDGRLEKQQHRHRLQPHPYAGRDCIFILQRLLRRTVRLELLWWFKTWDEGRRRYKYNSDKWSGLVYPEGVLRLASTRVLIV